jgi:hypothetical protein
VYGSGVSTGIYRGFRLQQTIAGVDADLGFPRRTCRIMRAPKAMNFCIGTEYSLPTKSLENSEMMQRSSHPARASRFKVPNNERVMLLVGTDLVSGTLRLLSLTGGTVRIPKRRAPGTFGEIRMSTVTGSITAVVELLSAIGDSVQAFRFVQIEPASRKRLQEALQHMKAQGLGDGRSDRLQEVLSFARRLLPRSMAI